MENHRLRIWRTVGMSVRLAAQSVRVFPLACLVVFVALLLIRNYRFPPTLYEVEGFRTGASLLKMALRTAVDAPLAVLVQRWIVLGERSETYWAMWRESRTARFFGALLLFNAVDAATGLLDALPISVSLMIWPIYGLWIGSIWLWTRLGLAFPIIATDAGRPGFAESVRETRGSSWRIFSVFAIIAIAQMAFGTLAIEISGGTHPQLGRLASDAYDAAWLAATAFFFLTYIATAAHLWRTRADWSARSQPEPSGAAASVARS